MKKKDTSLRLIVDARQPNAAHARPPLSRLSTVSALSSIDLSEGAIKEAHGGVAPVAVSPSVSSIDLRNGFYQFRIPESGSHFAMNFPGCASYCGADRVLNEQTGAYEAVVWNNLGVPDLGLVLLPQHGPEGGGVGMSALGGRQASLASADVAVGGSMPVCGQREPHRAGQAVGAGRR